MPTGSDSAQNRAKRRMPIKVINVEARERSKWAGRKGISCTRVENREVNLGFGRGVHSLNPWKVHSFKLNKAMSLKMALFKFFFCWNR